MAIYLNTNKSLENYTELFKETYIVDMLGVYYSKAVDSKDIFNTLKISRLNGYKENLNKYNVINISFNKIDLRT